MSQLAKMMLYVVAANLAMLALTAAFTCWRRNRELFRPQFQSPRAEPDAASKQQDA